MLSKSQYIRGLQCHKSLWLYKNQPELRTLPDAQQQAKFDTGHTVGSLACQLFPGGIEIEFDSKDFEGMVQRTQELIDQGVSIIYEATFKENGVFAMADILVKNDDKWDVYEVKASTSVKDYYQDDAAVQWYAFSKVLDLNRIAIVHINNQYIRQGDLDIDQLFTVVDITDIVLTKQAEIPIRLNAMEEMIKAEEPQVELGAHCTNPHECDFKAHCWKDIPSPSVFNLYRMNVNKKFDLYRQGIVEFEQIPSGQNLSDVQQVQVQSSINQQPLINKDVLRSFVDSVQFPIHFFDFETFQDAIPRFDGQKPYMKIPFQYSLHVLHEDGALEHKEFLGDENADPREDIVRQMIKDIEPVGSIMAFNKSFEQGVIRELAKTVSGYQAELMQMHERFIDLMDPFKQLGYYHPDFNGSFSIKSVLPAMFPDDPELDYKKLEIQNGGMAMDIFAKLHLLNDQNQRQKIRHDLLAYCHLDTLAMVKIYQKLVSLVA